MAQTIAAVRIDERLIHGQVATLWQGTWRCTRIMVIDEKSANDEVLKAVLKIACPSGVKLSVLGAEKAANNLKANKYDQDRITIVTKTPKVICELLDYGYQIPSVTVGNMSGATGKKNVAKSVAVTDEDIEAFKKLQQAGVELLYQMVPSSSPVAFMPLLEAAIK
ncbi:MAG: PTS sugar transporter subunit IIB [Erysipelotrichaceae bacterium]|jgi:PTS system mannose-specific IIB component|nr:PTS sugar transporter subunit IIB [Erysipelotrichaceae bacterium]